MCSSLFKLLQLKLRRCFFGRRAAVRHGQVAELFRKNDRFRSCIARLGMYFVVTPICIAENASVGAALSRCRFLTRGTAGKSFVAILLVGVLDLAISSIWFADVVCNAPEGTGWRNNGIVAALGAFNAVLAALFFDRLRLAKDGVHLAKVFD